MARSTRPAYTGPWEWPPPVIHRGAGFSTRCGRRLLAKSSCTAARAMRDTEVTFGNTQPPRATGPGSMGPPCRASRIPMAPSAWTVPPIRQQRVWARSRGSIRMAISGCSAGTATVHRWVFRCTTMCGNSVYPHSTGSGSAAIHRPILEALMGLSVPPRRRMCRVQDPLGPLGQTLRASCGFSGARVRWCRRRGIFE